MQKDLFFMEQAYKQALKAYAIDEVPIGAVLVDCNGVIVARGYNQVEKQGSQLAHAEMLALHKGSKKLGTWRLSSMTLYVTVQPCMMCIGSLYLSRVSRIVYGVSSMKYGVSVDQVKQIGIYQNLHTTMESVHYEPAKILLQLFFQKKRSMRDGQQGGSCKD